MLTAAFRFHYCMGEGKGEFAKCIELQREIEVWIWLRHLNMNIFGLNNLWNMRRTVILQQGNTEITKS